MSILFRQTIAFSAAFFLVVGQAEARQNQGGAIQVASNHLTTDQEVGGSNPPGRAIYIIFFNILLSSQEGARV